MTRTAGLRGWLLFLLLALPACDAVLVDTLDAASPDAAAVDAFTRPDTPPEDLDGFIGWQMAEGGIPGLAAAIVRPDDIEWVGTYGMADVEAGRAVDEHTLFIMASISKTAATVCALQLVEQGALDLDADVSTYVSYPVRHPDFPDVPITLRMLLAHVSGVEDDFTVLGGVTYNEDPPVTLAAFAEGYVVPGGAYYGEGNWGRAPLSRRSYANAGYGVVGHVLEVAGGAPFSEQTIAGVFEPLAMDGAGWFLGEVDAERLAIPYGYNGRSFNRLPQNGFAFYPASSMRVSITGLARYAQMFLRGGELDGVRVLSEESLEEAFRAQYPALDARQALTFSERRVAGNLYIGHSGSTFGGSTNLLLSRDLAHGILLITNSDAYIRGRLALTDGSDAMEAILTRLDAEARAR